MITYHNKIFVLFCSMIHMHVLAFCLIADQDLFCGHLEKKNKMHDCKQLPPLGYTQLKQQNTTTTKQKD